MSKAEKRKMRKRQRDLAAFLERATPEELAKHAAHEARVAKKAAKKRAWKAMGPEERAEYRRLHPKQKSNCDRDIPEQAVEDDAPECMKCGFRTWRDWCPDCGRPVWSTRSAVGTV